MLEVPVRFVRHSGSDPSDRLQVAEPVRFGVPFPRGALQSPTATLISPEQEEVAAQARVTARWPDGSVRWTLVDALLPPHASIGSGREWRCRLSDGTGAEQQTEDAMSNAGGGWLGWDDRGGWRFQPSPPTPSEQDLLLDLVLRDHAGRKYGPARGRLVTRQDGPIVRVERWEGMFAPTSGFPWRPLAHALCWRLCWEYFPQANLVRLRCTLRNAHRARHRGGCWDLGDPGSIRLQDATLCIRFPEPAQAWMARIHDHGVPRSLGGGFSSDSQPDDLSHAKAVPTLVLYQGSSGGENWRSYNHVDASCRVPCRLRGFRLRAPGEEWHGLRAEPAAGLRMRQAWILAAVPEFWQRFPKALRISASEIALGVLPAEWDSLHEIQGGEQVTTTLWLRWGTREGEPEGPAFPLGPPWMESMLHPVQACGDWEVAQAVEVADATVARSVYATLPVADFARSGLSGEQGLLANRERVDEYGWRHFGDVYADHEARFYCGDAPHVSHYNNQFDLLLGAMLQRCCGGDAGWDAVIHPLARHVIDIDIYHSRQDRASFNGGLFWLTDHYRTAHTCTHRAFSRHNAAHPNYGGGPSSEHNYTTGLMLYHYLFGEEDAKEAALSLADWVVAMEDGRQTPFFVLDAGPTGTATATSDADYHGPGRAAANSINALLDGWLLSGQRTYLDFAEGLLRRTVHPADDIASRRLHDAERRWSYTMYFEILARYLHLKATCDRCDEAYDYAAGSLMHYAKWMLEHERPFLDRRSELEYPTEVWAAQSLRQANVLWAAARLAEGQLCERLRERAADWTEQAWRDLHAFDCPVNARTLAVVLTAALRGASHRDAPALPRPRLPSTSFPPPEQFMPQRTRVKQMLRRPDRLLIALLLAAYPPHAVRLLNLLHKWRN